MRYMTTQEFRDSINISSGEDAMRFDRYEPSWNHTPESFKSRMRARIARIKANKESVTDAALTAGHAAMQGLPLQPTAAEPCTELCEDPLSNYRVTNDHE